MAPLLHETSLFLRGLGIVSGCCDSGWKCTQGCRGSGGGVLKSRGRHRVHACASNVAVRQEAFWRGPLACVIKTASRTSTGSVFQPKLPPTPSLTDSEREREKCHVTLEWAGHLAGAGVALLCWFCSASADVMTWHGCGASRVAVLVVQ